MPACSCNGANPDCCYCGGWGSIGDSVMPTVQHVHQGVSPADAAVSSIYGEKPGVKMIGPYVPPPPASGVAHSDHFQVYVPKPKPSKVRIKPKPPLQEFVPPPRALSVAPKAHPQKPKIPDPAFTNQCPICKCGLKDLARHMRKMHKDAF